MVPAGLALLTALAAAGEPPAEVRLPLAEYDALRRESPSVTVVDTLRIAGSFRARDLTVTLSGRASGRLASVPVLAATSAESLTLWSCEGDAIVSRADDGAFLVTPLATRFAARCRLVARSSDRLSLTSTRHVLSVVSEVTDGELVPAAEATAGERTTSVVRIAGGPKEVLEATVTGRYRLTLRPGETRFRHVLEVRNPNRTRRPFDVTLASGETVQQVDSEVPWDVDGGRFRFDLRPGNTTIVLSGTLPQARFTPPVKAAVQYVLLEAHPLLRPLVEGSPKRVSPAETGVATQFRGAQAFLLGEGMPLAWNVTALEAKRTAGFAVTSASHVIFLPADGPALGESSFGIDNQGAPDLTFPLRPDFTYAALEDESVFLTKNAEGSLWLPIGQGHQSVMLQHSQTLSRRFGIALGLLELPTLAVPASTSGVEVRFPKEWIPLYASFASESRFFLPGIPTIFALVLLFLCAERTLLVLGFAAASLRSAVSLLLALAGLFWGAVALSLVLSALLAGALVVWPAFRRLKTAVRVSLTVAGLGALLLLALSVVLSWAPADRAPARQVDRLAMDMPASARMKGRSALGGEEAARNVVSEPQASSDYAGLPARIAIPSGEREIDLHGKMLGSEAARRIHVVAVSAAIVELTLTLLFLGALALLWRGRRELRVGLERRIAAAKSSPHAVTPVP